MIGRRPAVLLLLLLALVVTIAVLAEGARGGQRERDAQRVVNAIAHEFGTGPLGACFWKLAWRESRLRSHEANWHDVHADGSRGSFGALQIGALWRRRGEPVHHFAQRMFDPVKNARLAHRLYERFGLQPWGWSCS